jgi:hypothetical protein
MGNESQATERSRSKQILGVSTVAMGLLMTMLLLEDPAWTNLAGGGLLLCGGILLNIRQGL